MLQGRWKKKSRDPPERFLQTTGRWAHNLSQSAVNLTQEVLPWEGGHKVGWREDRAIQVDHRRATRWVSEDFNTGICIVQLYIMTSEASTYVQVGGLPGRRRRKREKRRQRKTRQQQWHNRAYHGTKDTWLKYQTVITHEKERRTKVDLWKRRFTQKERQSGSLRGGKKVKMCKRANVMEAEAGTQSKHNAKTQLY